MSILSETKFNLDRVKRIGYLSPMRAATVQASLRIRAVSPEPPLLAHTSSESRGTFRQKARSLTPLNGWACAVKICHDGMLEDTNSLDGAHLFVNTAVTMSSNICWLLLSLLVTAPRGSVTESLSKIIIRVTVRQNQLSELCGQTRH